VLDVVNTHLEAGSGEEDHAVREQQVDLLTRRLRAASDGGALVLGGDLNLDFEDARERRLLETLRRELTLDDSGARPAPGSGWKRLDYVLYRSGARARLEVVARGMAEEFIAEGTPLSDHPALFTVLRVRPGSPVRPPP
jgi:endonuclease/exonuclease/phosphatase family metal-dependent hydrolase